MINKHYGLSWFPVYTMILTTFFYILFICIMYFYNVFLTTFYNYAILRFFNIFYGKNFVCSFHAYMSYFMILCRVGPLKQNLSILIINTRRYREGKRKVYCYWIWKATREGSHCHQHYNSLKFYVINPIPV